MTASPAMTTERDSARKQARVTGRLIILLQIALFFVGASATFIVRRVAASMASEQTQSKPATVPAAELPQLPPDLDRKLASAFQQEQIIKLAQYADPFVDRNNFIPAPPVQTIPAVATIPPPVKVPDLLTRLTDWQREYKAARQSGRTPPPRMSAYLYTELAPVGSVHIQGQQKIWVYIQPEKFALPVSIGARFYDATLTGANSDGALFRTSTGESKLIEWSNQVDVDAVRDDEKSDKEEKGKGGEPTEQMPPASVPNSTNAAPTAEHKLNRGTDLNALQDAVRERYHRAGKPVSYLAPPKFNRSITPAFNFDSIAMSETAGSTIADNNFVAPFAQTKPRKRRAGENLAAENRVEENDKRDALFVRASFARIDEQELQQTAKAQPPTSLSPEPTPTPNTTTLSSPTGEEKAAAAGHSSSPSFPAAPNQITTAQNTTAKSGTGADKNGPNPFCDPSYIGEPISIETTRPLIFSDLIRTINSSFKANIVLDSDVQNLPISLTFIDAPWNQIVRTQLELNDLDMICTEGNKLVQIAKRAKITQIQDQKRKTAPIVRTVFKLRYLQPTAGGRTDLAGRVQGGAGATIQSLDDTIREILRAGGDTRSEFRRIPGRNEFLVAAAQEQLDDIRRVIERVDRPGYQVLIKALIYNVNEDRLRDIGSQLSVIVGNGSQSNLGGFTTLPNTPREGSNNGGTSGSGGSNQPSVAGRNPAGIPTPGRNFATPGGLEAGAPTAVFGATTIVGTAQFAYQLTLAQNRGIANIQSRPFGVVSDGDTFDLVSGVQIPVVTAAIAGGAAFGVGQVQFIEASRIARITPQVAEIDEGKAGFVTLLIQLENNDVGSVLYNGLPGVNRQSLQTVLRLRNNETAVIGGLSTDSVQRNSTKVPGLGDIPGFGWLFKRRFDQESRNRLYFAISVNVIGQDQGIFNVAAPADATTMLPAPPPPQQPHLTPEMPADKLQGDTRQ